MSTDSLSDWRDAISPQKKGVAGSQDGTWHRLVDVQPSPREELIQRSSPYQEEFSAVRFISDKGAPQANQPNNIHARPEGGPHDYRNILATIQSGREGL